MLFDRHDVVIGDKKGLIEDVKDDLLCHHFAHSLLPTTRKQLTHDLDQHRQCFVLDRARLETTLVQRGVKRRQEDQPAPLNEHLHELSHSLRNDRLLLSRCSHFGNFCSAVETAGAAHDALVHEHDVVEGAGWHASILALAEKLGPHWRILIAPLVLKDWHALDLLIDPDEHLMVDRQLLQQANDLPRHLLLLGQLGQQAQKLGQKRLILSNQAPRVLIVQLMLVDPHNLELLDQICTDCIVVDALIKWALLRDNLKLADS